MSESIRVRVAQWHDLATLMEMMHALAVYEGYDDELYITAESLANGLFKNKNFEVLVAEKSNKVVGLLVFYALPFTYDSQPWLFIKELFVKEAARGQGVGKGLMQHLQLLAHQRGVSRIRWHVLRENHAAQQFYQSLGAGPEPEWLLYSLRLSKSNT